MVVYGIVLPTLLTIFWLMVMINHYEPLLVTINHY
jgi:hypothetical protein